MASTSTGEMFTQEQYDAMTAERRQELDIVRITPQQEAKLTLMSLEERKQYLKTQKTKSRKVVNKRERQNRRKARATR